MSLAHGSIPWGGTRWVLPPLALPTALFMASSQRLVFFGLSKPMGGEEREKGEAVSELGAQSLRGSDPGQVQCMEKDRHRAESSSGQGESIAKATQ